MKIPKVDVKPGQVLINIIWTHNPGDDIQIVKGDLRSKYAEVVAISDNASGGKEWWVKGKEHSEEEFNKLSQSCDGKVVEIDGQKYVLKKV